MMRAAVYARKSNEQDVQEEVRSVTRQLEHGRAFAESKGWSVKDDHVFSDDAISGMHGEEKRPGLKLLLATMELVPRPFDVIVMASDDRLMRNQLKVGAVLERIQEAGVDLYYYLENRKVDLSTVVGQFMESVHAMAAHDYRVKLARHTRDGMKARAKAGFVIGGRTFGYDHVPVDRGEVSTRKTRRVPMTRVINEAQANIVRDIFTRYAAGQSPKQIARTLNSRPGILVPGGKHGIPMLRWSRHQVRETLQHVLYTGVLLSTWNGEQIRVERPDLRIIEDDLWQQTRARFANLREQYIRMKHGQLLGRPAHSVESAYLLTGLIQCGVCGRSMLATTRKRANHTKRKYYQCVSNMNNRRRACDNTLLAPMDATDAAVLQAVEQSVLNPSILCDAIAHALSKLDGTENRQQEQTRLAEELSQLDTQMKHLADSIAKLGGNDTLLDEVRQREARRQEIGAERSRLESLESLSTLDLGQVEQDLRRITDEWKGAQGFTNRHPAAARTILKKVLPSKLILTPHPESRSYSFAGDGAIGPLLGQVVSSQMGKGQGSSGEGRVRRPNHAATKDSWTTSSACCRSRRRARA